MITLEDALVIARAVHFAATLSASGVVLFCALQAGPLSGQDLGVALPSIARWRLNSLFSISIAVALLSGVAWLLLVAAAIGDQSAAEIFGDGILSSIVTETEFGRFSIARLAIGALLAGAVWSRHLGRLSSPGGLAQTALAVAYLVSIAVLGHAAATPGITGDIHLISDGFHLLAAGIWAGGLLPYAMALDALRTAGDAATTTQVVALTRRFSRIGIVAVGTIAASGIANASNLVASRDLLWTTDYGRLLALKIALFLAMVMIAAVNRLFITPRLTRVGQIKALVRNSLIEALLALAIVLVVARLGVLPPAVHGHAH